MPIDLKPIPKNIVEVEQQAFVPYLPSVGKPDSTEGTVFSHNRSEDLSRKNDKVKDITIGLEDIDDAIQYYFENVIKPVAKVGDQQKAVPIIFGDSEKWKSAQKDGFYRDKNGKIMYPLIEYKRVGISKNRNLGNKLDGNKVHNYQLFQTKYNRKNVYDNFSVLNNRIPSKQYYVSVVPDYVDVTYECTILTDFIDQNNKIIEAVNFASDSYWGNFNLWHFKSKIDTFTIANSINQGEDRVAKTTFNLIVNAYLIPDSVNKRAASANLYYSPAQIIFDIEISGDAISESGSIGSIRRNQVMGGSSFIGGGNNITNSTVINNYSGISVDDLTYLSTNLTIIADIVVADTATFSNISFLQPASGSAIPATSIDDFQFYANTLPITVNEISGWNEDGLGNVVLVTRPDVVGYHLEGKTIVAVGKFKSNP